MQRIFLTDDDRTSADLVGEALTGHGFTIEQLRSGRETLERVRSGEPAAAILLEMVLPDMTGTDVCRSIRQFSDLPVLFLTDVDEEVDRIVGLEVGADDYLTKPYHPRELLARLRAVLRRWKPDRESSPGGDEGDDPVMEHGPFRLDVNRHRVTVDGQRVVLTRMEFLLMKTLMTRPTCVYTRDELMDGAYGPGTCVSHSTINSHIRRLRNKLDEAGFNPIESVRGVGYRIREIR